MIVERASKRVLDDDYVQTGLMLGPGPLLDCRGAKSWQIVLEVSARLEDGPKLLWHSENETHKRNIWQQHLLLSLPVERPAIAATWAALSFTGMTDYLLTSC